MNWTSCIIGFATGCWLMMVVSVITERCVRRTTPAGDVPVTTVGSQRTIIGGDLPARMGGIGLSAPDGSGTTVLYTDKDSPLNYKLLVNWGSEYPGTYAYVAVEVKDGEVHSVNWLPDWIKQNGRVIIDAAAK